jgi:hypothetical protein
MRGEANGEEAPQQPHPVRGEEEDDDDERQQPDQGPPQQRRHGHAQRTASRPSSGQQQQQPPVAMRSVGYVGKHRLSAAIARLDQELQLVQVRASLSPVSTETRPLLSHGSVPVFNSEIRSEDSPCCRCCDSDLALSEETTIL